MPQAAGQSGPEGADPVFSQLRKLGFRATSARICVLQILHGDPSRSLAAERVFRQLGETGARISLGTVYRVLNELERAGAIHKEWHAADTAGKHRYCLAPSGRGPSSYRFACRVCGRATVVADKPFVEMMRRQARAAGFDLGLADLVLDGCCNECSQRPPPRGVD